MLLFIDVMPVFKHYLFLKDYKIVLFFLFFLLRGVRSFMFIFRALALLLDDEQAIHVLISAKNRVIESSSARDAARHSLAAIYEAPEISLVFPVAEKLARIMFRAILPLAERSQLYDFALQKIEARILSCFSLTDVALSRQLFEMISGALRQEERPAFALAFAAAYLGVNRKLGLEAMLYLSSREALS